MSQVDINAIDEAPILEIKILLIKLSKEKYIRKSIISPIRPTRLNFKKIFILCCVIATASSKIFFVKDMIVSSFLFGLEKLHQESVRLQGPILIKLKCQLPIWLSEGEGQVRFRNSE